MNTFEVETVKSGPVKVHAVEAMVVDDCLLLTDGAGRITASFARSYWESFRTVAKKPRLEMCRPGDWVRAPDGSEHRLVHLVEYDATFPAEWATDRVWDLSEGEKDIGHAAESTMTLIRRPLRVGDRCTRPEEPGGWDASQMNVTDVRCGIPAGWTHANGIPIDWARTCLEARDLVGRKQ